MANNRFVWPDGKRIAVAMTIALETWSEGKSPPYYHSAKSSGLKSGVVDSAGVAWASYGGKVGVYRVIRLLREHGIRGTFLVNGCSAELFPDAITEIIKGGHEIAAHGYYQDQLNSYMAPDEEKALIGRCLNQMEQITGTRPKGWISPTMAYSPHTRELLAEAGLLWDGDSRDADLPSLVDTSRGRIVHIPGSNFTDVRVLESSSMALWDIYSETFGYLYRDAQPSLLVMAIHCHFGGRPTVAAVFDKILKHIGTHQDVWFATYAEIAQWVKDNQLQADPRSLVRA